MQSNQPIILMDLNCILCTLMASLVCFPISEYSNLFANFQHTSFILGIYLVAVSFLLLTAELKILFIGNGSKYTYYQTFPSFFQNFFDHSLFNMQLKLPQFHLHFLLLYLEEGEGIEKRLVDFECQ